MPNISVIMSIYNESQEYVKESVDSILNQSFNAFEFIIVVDNPNIDKQIKDYLNTLPSNVVVIYNQVNIGLAMSMNKAASVAKGKYLARMDADDISQRDRLKIQFEEMENNGYDMTCTYTECINEQGKIMDIHPLKTKIQCLPYMCTVKHPTVMMKKETFDSVGGYRNFPCAQDYDLWLRFIEKNISMHYIDLPLLKYRIRKNSISGANFPKQQYTAWYIQNLYREWKKTGKDSFSEDNYKNYLDDSHLDKAYKEMEKKKKSDVYKFDNKKRFLRYFIFLRLCLSSRFYRKVYTSRLISQLVYRMM